MLRSVPNPSVYTSVMAYFWCAVPDNFNSSYIHHMKLWQTGRQTQTDKQTDMMRGSRLWIDDGQFFGSGGEGALPPTTPVNPYLGGSARKKWATFYTSCTLVWFKSSVNEVWVYFFGFLLPPWKGVGRSWRYCNTRTTRGKDGASS